MHGMQLLRVHLHTLAYGSYVCARCLHDASQRFWCNDALSCLQHAAAMQAQLDSLSADLKVHFPIGLISSVLENVLMSWCSVSFVPAQCAGYPHRCRPSLADVGASRENGN